MMTNLEVIAINYGMEVLLMSDDTNIPVTTWLDDGNEECSKEEAIDCVAGPDAAGKWHRCELKDFDSETTH